MKCIFWPCQRFKRLFALSKQIDHYMVTWKIICSYNFISGWNLSQILKTYIVKPEVVFQIPLFRDFQYFWLCWCSLMVRLTYNLNSEIKLLYFWLISFEKYNCYHLIMSKTKKAPLFVVFEVFIHRSVGRLSQWLW